MFSLAQNPILKELSWEPPNRETQEYCGSIIGMYQGPYVPTIYSHFILEVSCLGVPVKTYCNPHAET